MILNIKNITNFEVKLKKKEREKKSLPTQPNINNYIKTIINNINEIK